MKRLYIFVLLLLSAFYSFSNEQMGGYSSSGQMGDSSMPNNDRANNEGAFAPGSFIRRTPQPGFSKPRPSIPSMQRTEVEPMSLEGAPGSQPIQVQKNIFSNMPEIERPDERPKQMGEMEIESSLNSRFEFCHGFYGN